MMRGHIPLGERLRERQLTREHQLARARQHRRRMHERLVVAQIAFDVACDSEARAEREAAAAALKVAALAAPPDFTTGTADSSPAPGPLAGSALPRHLPALPASSRSPVLRSGQAVERFGHHGESGISARPARDGQGTAQSLVHVRAPKLSDDADLAQNGASRHRVRPDDLTPSPAGQGSTP